MSRKWANDPIAESKIKFFDNLDWKTKVVPMKEIDKSLSMQLNARIGDRTNAEALDAYYRSMNLGDVFPRIVLFSSTPSGVNSKGFVIAGGIHRFLTAEKLKDKEIEAYVISGDDLRVWDLLPLSLNRDHGLQATQKEAMIKAKVAVTKHGMSPKESSQLFNVSAASLQKELLAQNIEERLIMLGVKNVENMNVLVKQRLSVLSDNDVILKATANLLIKNDVANDPALLIIDRVKQQRSESAALGFLDRESMLGSKTQVRGNKVDNRQKRSITNRQRFLMALANMEKILAERDTLELNGISQKDEQEEVSDRCSAVAKKLTKLTSSFKKKSGGLVGNLTGRFPMAFRARNGSNPAKRSSARSSI